MAEGQKRLPGGIAIKVLIVSVICNVSLALFKLAAGVLAGSSALVSDAVHSLTDVSGTFIVMIGVKLSGKESDSDHQYGHERVECVAALIIAGLLFAIGLGIGAQGFKKILAGNYGDIAEPGLLALIAAFISIAVKEGMYWYTRSAAKKIDSSSLMVEAWHHRSDALSTIGGFAGILGARLGFPILDSVASVIICLFIVKAACGIFADAIGKMTDKACDEKTSDGILSVILKQEGVLGIDQLKTRLFGNRIYVDIEIQARGDLTLGESHAIAQKVHDAVENGFPNVKHCMVHVNPAE